MWLILSRKGFDSEYGSCTSPIFPDRTMFSLPIPSGDRERLEDLRYGEVDIASVVIGIANRRMSGRDRVHLDPDLDFNAYPYRRDRNALQRRRGMPGQAGAAQSHLNSHGVDGSDLFLFFGLCRRVEETTQGWRFVRGAPNLHILWGRLQVDQKRRVADIRPDHIPWACHHPHVYECDRSDKNTVHAASLHLDMRGDYDQCEIAGWGVFPKLDRRLVLTDPTGAGVSNPQLPRWFYPTAASRP